MTTYVAENEAIEGKEILCVFEHRPSFRIEKASKRQQITTTGNPATATLAQVWEYKQH
jgi:hypothetical protein